MNPPIPRPAATDAGLSRQFWPLQAAGWLGYIAFSYIVAIGHGKPYDYWKVIVPVAASGFIATSGLRYVLRALWRRPAPVLLVAAVVPVLLCAVAMGLTSTYVWVAFCGTPDCRPHNVAGYIASMGSYTYVVLSWAGLYFGIKNWRELQAQTQATLQATAMAHQAQLKMLRYQLNPHFLFNTLNAISTLVLDQDHQTANRMVTSLSAFLRHSLDADPMQRVTLKQELDAINLYLGIEKVRFAERLRLHIEVEPEAYSALMPSLLLQPLIENAIKYAVAKRVEGGTLELAARRVDGMLEIALRDDGPGFAHPEGDLPGGNGVGLRNTRERLRVLYGERQSFVLRNRQPQGAEIVLRLPFEAAGTPRE